MFIIAFSLFSLFRHCMTYQIRLVFNNNAKFKICPMFWPSDLDFRGLKLAPKSWIFFPHIKTHEILSVFIKKYF